MINHLVQAGHNGHLDCVDPERKKDLRDCRGQIPEQFIFCEPEIFFCGITVFSYSAKI